MTSVTAPAPTGQRGIRPVTVAKGAAVLVGGLLLGLVLAPAVVSVVATRFFDYNILRVSSSSMEPTYSVGDLVVTRPKAIMEVEEGDVIYFTLGDAEVPTIHRVVAINDVTTVINDPDGNEVARSVDRRLVTQGDATPRPDSYRSSVEDLRGEVWFSVPYVGGALEFPLQTFLFALAGILAVGWVSWEIYRRMGRSSSDAGGAAGP